MPFKQLMTFNEFIKKLRIKNHLYGILDVDDHRLNFAKMFLLNKVTRFNSAVGTRQTGKSTHNLLLAIFNYIYKKETSLIVVFTTEDKSKVVRDLINYVSQISGLKIDLFSSDFKHDYIDIISLNAWTSQKQILRKKYNNIFIDNQIIDQYHDFSRHETDAPGNKFFINLCEKFSLHIQQLQLKKEEGHLNGMVCLENKIITSDGIEFNIGDLFMISSFNDESSNIGSIVKINYNNLINWASTVDILFCGNMIKMPIQNIEYFTKLNLE